MGRPKKSITQLKLLQINIRVTLEEQVVLEEFSKSYGLSITNYIRKRALQKQLPKFKLPTINRELLIELSRIGNNINQLTRKANQYQFNTYDLNLILSKLKNQIEEIKKTLLI